MLSNRRKLASYIGAGVAPGGGGGVVPGLPAFAYQAQTDALAASMASAPSSRRKYSYNRAIDRLKRGGVWSKITSWWTMGDTLNATTRDWKGVNHLTVQGSPTFVANDYVLAPSAVTDKLDTGIPLSAIPQNNHTFAVFTKTTPSVGATDSGEAGAIETNGHGLAIYARNSSQSAFRALDFSDTPVSVAGSNFVSGVGLHAITRSDASNVTGDKSGARMDTIASASSASASSRTLTFLGVNGAAFRSPRRWAGGFLATALTEAELQLCYAVMAEYLEAIQYGEPTYFDAGYAPSNVSADIIIYGATSGAVVAAYEAHRRGLNPIIVGGWRDTNLGGMSSNGLGWTDLFSTNALWGLSAYVFARLKVLAGRADSNIYFEPRTFEWVMREMLDPTRANGRDVPVYWSTGAINGTKTAGKLTSITTADGRTFSAPYVLDCSYEGDLMPIGGIPFVMGREAAGTGRDAQNGYRPDVAQRFQQGTTQLNIDPYVTPGVPGSGLIAGLVAKPAAAAGSADNLTQAFTYRLTWGDSGASRIPFFRSPPPGYDKTKEEILLRMFDAAPTLTIAQIFKIDTLFNNVRDINNGPSRYGIDDAVNTNEYVLAANYADREAALQKIMRRVQGFVYLCAHDPDPRIPASFRTAISAFGWSNMHYFNEGKPGDLLFFPRQLYVREMRRMVNDLIWNGNDISATDGTTPRSTKTVATASYYMDSHVVQRYADTVGGVPNVMTEGEFLDTSGGGTDKISPIPLEVFLPRKSDCQNVGVMFGCASNHPAFGAIRMEPTFMEACQMMAFVVKQARDAGNIALQDVDYAGVRSAALASASLTGETTPNLPQVN